MQLSRPPLPSRSWVKTGTYIRALFGGYMRLFFMSGHGGGEVREHFGRDGVRACGVSKRACLLARGHPAGAGAPCWSTALLAKSSVLDLLRPPGRERGCAGQNGHFPAPAEQRISAGGAACGYPLFLPPVGEPSKDDGAPGLGRRVAGAAVVVLRRVAVAGVYPRSLGSMRPSAACSSSKLSRSRYSCSGVFLVPSMAADSREIRLLMFCASKVLLRSRMLSSMALRTAGAA